MALAHVKRQAQVSINSSGDISRRSALMRRRNKNTRIKLSMRVSFSLLRDDQIKA
jgi:hypothetical protein